MSDYLVSNSEEVAFAYSPEEVASAHLLRELRALALSTVLAAAVPRLRLTPRKISMSTTSRMAITSDFFARRALAHATMAAAARETRQ